VRIVSPSRTLTVVEEDLAARGAQSMRTPALPRASMASPYSRTVWSNSGVPGAGSASVVRLSRNMYFTIGTSYRFRKPLATP
jgi:hypothetical protein